MAVLAAGASGCKYHGGNRSAGATVRAIEGEPWGAPDQVLVSVNGRPITRGEFYLRVLRRFGTMKLFAGVIKEELFLQEAERLGLAVPPEVIDERVRKIVGEYEASAGGRSAFEAQYEREGLSIATMERDLRREVSTQLLIGKVVQTQREITDEVLERYYRETYKNRRYLTRQIAYSFFTDPTETPETKAQRKMEARSKALRAVDRVRAGADFKTIARTESEDSVTSKNGGWIGAVHLETPMKHPQFLDAIFKLEPGGVSEPVENPDGGYHVFLVEEIVESQTFADCRARMTEEIRALEPDPKEIELVLRTLQQRAQVEVNSQPFAELSSAGAAKEAASPATPSAEASSSTPPTSESVAQPKPGAGD